MSKSTKPIFTASENMKNEYCAKIVHIGEMKDIEGSDFLVQTIVDGNSIVISKGMFETGEPVIYCMNETQLNKEFLSVNNQFEIGSLELNKNAKEVLALMDEGKNDEAKKLVGFFNKHGRVKLIRLRGCPSYGCIFKKQSLANWNKKLEDVNLEDYFTVDENGYEHPFEFDTVDGKLFIEAYVPPMPQESHRRGDKLFRKRMKKLQRFDRMVPGQFAYHYSTSQLQANMWRFTPDTIVTISNKLHGCVEKNTSVETMEFGTKTIGEIVDGQIDCHIKCYDTNIDECVWAPVDNFYMIPDDGEWYEIELENGKKITITGNNPVWLPILNAYRRVDELNGDEYLLMDK